MSFLFTVTGVLDTKDAARAFRAVLAASGIAHERIRLAGRDPARSTANVGRNGACLVSVDVRSPGDRMRVEALMAAAGAR